MNEVCTVRMGMRIKRFSARAAAVFLAGSALAADPQLVINELMAHPLDVWLSNQPLPTVNDTEYIEIYNAGTTAVSLANYRFDNGVDFTFTNGTLAVGAYGVLCENYAFFTNAYRTVTNLLGEYNGNLKNGGERVTLSRFTGSNWVTEDTIEYIGIDEIRGTGKSLELVHPKFARLDDQFSWDWVASSTVSGTPGVVNSRFTAAPLPVGGDIRQDRGLPPTHSSVKITARASGRDGWASNALSSVLLEYRLDALAQAAYTNTPMRDDGIEGDAAANDGVFTAFLPPHGSFIVANNGDMIEFRIKLTDPLNQTRTIPATNRTGISGTTYSCLVKFGQDTFSDAAYPGEYETFHILLTAANKNLLQTRDPYSDDLIDATVVVGNKVFYSAGVRLRGGSSRNSQLGNYRVEIPPGQDLDGFTKINLNHFNALRQHIGMVITDRSTGGYAFDSSLARVFLNAELKNPSQGIYHRFETFGGKMMDRIYGPDAIVNLYSADGDYRLGYLNYVDENLASYQNLYFLSTNNPYTAWNEMLNLSRAINMPVEQLPTVLTNYMNVPLFGALFGTQVAMGNGEAGILTPTGQVRGDELRVVADTATGRFDIFPWDYDDVIQSGTPLWGFGNGEGSTNVQKFLFNHPVAPYYVGNARDVITTVMSEENMSALFDDMGSKMSGLKASYLTTIATERSSLLAEIATNLTVNGLSAGAPAMLVPSTGGAAQINLGGTAPQSYTANITVNGVPTTWNLRDNIWSMINPLAIAGDVAEVAVRAVHPNGSTLKELRFKAVGERSPQFPGPTVNANTTWSPSAGIYVINNDVTVNPGFTLTIDPRATLLFHPGRKLIVNGTLAIRGTNGAPVNAFPYSGTTGWSIEASGAAASVVISNANFAFGRVVASSGATLRIYDSSLSGSQDTDGIVRATGAAYVSISRSVVSNFNRLRFDTTPTLIDQCLLTDMSAIGIEFTGAAVTSTVSRTTLRNPLGTDGIVFTGATAGLATNVLIQNMSGTGVVVNASTARLVNSLLDANATGVRVTGASAATILGCTIDGGTNSLNGLAAVTNSILWDALVSVTNGPATVTACDVKLPGNSVYSGAGNMNRKAFFRDTALDDYQLLSISPCLGTGVGGANIGASHPTGANPVAPAGLSLLATSNAVFLTWTDLSADESGFQIERSDGGNTYTIVATTAANATNYTDAGLGQDNSYYYRVRAVHARGASTYTDVATIRTTFQNMTQLLIQYLRITEIMYNPAGSDDAEFLEFKNISTNAVLNLNGLYMDGDRYTFTNVAAFGPQQFFVLARNAAIFAAAHPGVPIGGVYAPPATGLSNSGETLYVQDATGTDILRFDYADGSGGNSWYPTTDDGGYSLVPNLPNPYTGDPDDDLFWRASSAVGGSPGANDPEPAASGIVINEVLAHTDLPLEDAIEVRNIGTNAVNISGWYLSDSLVNLKKFQIPSVSAIPAGGYRVFYAVSFSNAFLISELGDESVYLSAATNNNLTGYRSTFSFVGAVANGESHGRLTRSDGVVETSAMSSRSFGEDNPDSVAEFRSGTGGPNPGPRVGPVVINEIMYNPGPGGLEYIELLNTTAGSAKLYNTNFSPTNAWNAMRFDGACEFTFPLNTALNPGEHILLTGRPPAEFRAAMGIDPSVRIFGPFDGDLSNGGETIKLYRPGSPEANGFVPQIIADRVQYGDAYPWPAAADGDGPSLEKLAGTLYGNDPTNWLAVSVGGTPGFTNNTAAQTTVGFADAADSAVETNEIVNIAVTLQPAQTSTVTVYYAVTGGTAASGVDYSLAAGSMVFWPYETAKSIPLTIINDSSGEPNETIVVTLTNLTGSAILGGNRVYTHTIVDNDTTNLAPPSIIPSGTTDFTNSILVTMIPSVPESTIYYTFSGNVPDSNDRLYTGPLALTHSATITARTFLGPINAGVLTTSVVFRAQPIPAGWTPPPGLPPNAVQIPVQASSDDGHQIPQFNSVKLTDATIPVMTNANFAFGALFRFYGVGIPQGVVVTNAYVQFTAAADSGAPAFSTIRGEATNSAATLVFVARNISNRLLTTNRVFWTPPAWAGSARGPNQRTPNLAPILTEIVGRPGWAISNALAIIFTNSFSGLRSAHSFDGSPGQSAVLYAEWHLEAPTQFYLTALTNGAGTISGGNLFVAAGLDATATAAPNAGRLFAGWTGDTQGDTSAAALTVTMNQNRTIVANFVLPPLVPASVLAPVSVGASNQFTLRWASDPLFVYSVYRTTSLIQDPLGTTLSSNIAAHPSGTNTYTDTSPPTPAAFYSIGTDHP